MSEEIQFDGFVAPDGELVSIKDVDRMLSLISRRTENRDEIVQALWTLAEECSEGGYLDAATAYFEKILILADEPGEKAACLLAMGQAYERARNFHAALEVYFRAFEFPQEPGPVWYFLNNNIGYCLNIEGRYQEAEEHCRAAIKINPDRSNAHKNLGISLRGQGRNAEAAKSFMAAIMACPEDGRALQCLEELFAAQPQPEILEQEPGLLEQLRKCYKAVESVRGKPRIQ
jgi:tetratricopeptide (TPR) repeat protein